MAEKTYLEEFVQDESSFLMFQYERLNRKATEAIAGAMEQSGTKIHHLARRLIMPTEKLRDVMDDRRPPTFSILCKTLAMCGYEAEITIKKIDTNMMPKKLARKLKRKDTP